jgi:hypothetical protein
MKNKITLAALAVLVTTASAFTIRNESVSPAAVIAASTAGNAAFRDGLYMGKFASQNGDQYLAATGRWARAEDRASFAAGYDQGYKANATISAAK